MSDSEDADQENHTIALVNTDPDGEITKQSYCCGCNTMPAQEMIDQLKTQPSFLIEGKWSPTSYIWLILCFIGGAIAAKWAFDTYPEYTEPSPSKHSSYFIEFIWRFIIFIYGSIVLCYILKIENSLWPLWSFTMMSWNLFTIRYLFSSIYHLVGGRFFFSINESLRFPSLVCNTITVSVWWVVLTPLICCVYWYQAETRQDGINQIKAFLKFNIGPVFINIHFLNLPLSALDHILYKRELTFFDLWAGLFVAMCYIVVYLFVMDKRGLYFYHVLLSPRPHWCFLCYLFVMALFVAYWAMWNKI